MAAGDAQQHTFDNILKLVDRASGIESKVSGLETKVDVLFEEFRIHRKATDTYRTDLKIVVAALTTSNQDVAKQITEIKEPTQALAARMAEMTFLVGALRTDLNEVKPDIADYRSNRDKAIGAVQAGKLMWVALLGLASMLSGFVAVVMTKVIG